MKVKDLILRLQACNPDNPDNVVVIDGYEGGVTELENVIDDVTIDLNVNNSPYMGEHETVDCGYKPAGETAQATYLER